MDHKNGGPWSAIDLFDLRIAIKRGDTMEEAAALLCRCGCGVDEVTRKAEELGLVARRGPRR